VKTSRQVAFQALNKINLQGGYSNIVIDNMVNTSQLDIRDSAFATMLVYGVVERQITLDAIISKYSSIKLEKIDSNILQILRLGIYQILFMDSVPDRAAVNESVELAKSNRLSKASGYVNAVLRSCLRNRETLLDFSNVLPLSKRFSLMYSCPQWLVDMWICDYGEAKTEEFLKSTVGKAPTFIRVNTLKTNAKELIDTLKDEGIECKETSVENALEVTNPALAIKSKAFSDGLFHVQDIASQICVRYADIKPNTTVLDVCSAPGGKAFTAAQYMNDEGKLFAFDLHQKRVNLIKQGTERFGIKCINANVGDATVFNADIVPSDTVLCDVVCSGLGVIRRKPETKYKNPEDITRLPQTQLKILTTASKYVKVGGSIVYSTCTVNKNENENVVELFLKENPNFDYYHSEEKCITLFGSDNNSDGFFMCKLKRLG
jgi:16S rRNA (cytosine967-C5)-methyltransferase